MSLLMQALRKAEEAKRAAAQTEGSSSADSSALALEPLAPTPIAESVTEEVEASVTAPKQTPLNMGTPAAPPATRSAPQNSRTPTPAQSAAQNVFAAKTVGAKSPFIKYVVGGGLFAAVGIVAYFWWQLQPASPRPVLQTATPAPMLPPQPSQPPMPPVTASAPIPSTPIATAAPPATVPAETFPSANSAAAKATPSSPIRLSSNKATLNPLATQAYDAMQAGNITLAQQLYQKLLGSDPYHTDALYGLAAIAIQRNQSELAEGYYLRLLEADPRDAIATAGLTGLQAKAPSANTESHLKQLIAERPTPVLYFALGNFYARAERWRDAQQAYFSAYQGDSESPDFAFNLAVSLDQLRQQKLALQYYSIAVQLAKARPAAFNPAQVQERMRELQAQ